MRTALLLVAALLSSGCISAIASDSPAPATTDAPTAASPGSGAAATHGAPQRTETPVTVTLGTDGFTAAKDVTVANDFGGAANGRVVLQSTDGAVTAKSWDQGGYQIVAHLEGHGASEQEARAALDTLTVVNQDALSSSLLDFGLQVKFNDPPSPAPTPVPINLGNGLRRSASIVASLPAGPAEIVQASTTNGAVGVDGLHGPSLKLETTNGDIQTSGSWDQAGLDTTNGGIHLAGLVNDLTADTTNGGIDGTLESSRSCHESLDTTNGNIAVKVKDQGHGYDLSGDTTNGKVTIDVEGAKASGKDSQHVQTKDYAAQAVQVTLKAGSTNGDVGLTSA